MVNWSKLQEIITCGLAILAHLPWVGALCEHTEKAGKSCSIAYYIDVIMSTMASQITIHTVVCSIVWSDADQRQYQSSASLAFGGEFTGLRWIPRTKDQ